MAAVYSLLREPSLALLGTHTYTFYFQHFPSGYTYPLRGPRRTGGDSLARLVERFGLRCQGTSRAFPSWAAVFLMQPPAARLGAILARLVGKKRGPEHT